MSGHRAWEGRVSELEAALLPAGGGGGRNQCHGAFVDFASVIVVAPDVHWSFGALDLAQDARPVRPRQVLVAPVLQGEQDDEEFPARIREHVREASPLSRFPVGHLLHHAVCDQRVQACGENVRHQPGTRTIGSAGSASNGFG